jgi:hypothetical protein
VVPINDGEVETEFLCEFVLPLQQHRSGRGDNNHVDAAPQQQFTHDQARLDRLAETDIIGNQQIDTWQIERLGEREKLVGVEPNAGAKGSLEELSIG